MPATTDADIDYCLVQLTRIQFSGPEQAVTNARYMFVNDVNRKNMQMLEQQQQQMQVDFNSWTRLCIPTFLALLCAPYQAAYEQASGFNLQQGTQLSQQVDY